MHNTLLTTAIFLAIFFCAGCSPKGGSIQEYSTWEVRGANKEQNRYSTLDQIDTANVSQLKIAWTYHTNDADTGKSTQIQANPIIIGHTLYSTTPKLKLFALEAATGKEKWIFDPYSGNTTDKPQALNNNRGVTYWQDGEDRRILYTAGSYLYAINAETGEPVEHFGKQGKTSLRKGFSQKYNDHFVTATSPGTIYRDLIIIGSRVSEAADASPGHIRAFNVRTGELAWVFHTIPQPGEFGYDTWKDPEAWKRTGGANSWAGMALDEERGIIFIPTGSASPDFYGGNRKGANLFANSLLALDAATGERIWHFQTIHHDLWDRDLPSPPSLVTVTRDGKQIDAVAQTTKTGFVLLFDRETGTPLFEIEEKPVPVQSDLEGEEVWPTQPIPPRPEPFARQHMSVDDINPYVPLKEQQSLREQLRGLKSDHMFATPSIQGTLMVPDFDGGAEWGGSAFDPQTGLLYVNSNDVPAILQIIDTKPENSELLSGSLAWGQRAYMSGCVSCHGTDRQGSARSPSLIGIGDRRSPGEMFDLINSGRGMMPAFNRLPEAQKKAIVNFLINKEYYDVAYDEQKRSNRSGSSERYILNGYQRFKTSEGYPANSPPWGRLSAINLNSGKYVWQLPLGEYPELKARGIPPTGTQNYGGPAVTKGGLLFIAATPDKKIRAFNKRNGTLLWEEDLPFAGFATPGIYQVDGKQYVVIACGGGKLGAKSGDGYVAFSLP